MHMAGRDTCMETAVTQWFSIFPEDEPLGSGGDSHDEKFDDEVFKWLAGGTLALAAQPLPWIPTFPTDGGRIDE